MFYVADLTLCFTWRIFLCLYPNICHIYPRSLFVFTLVICTDCLYKADFSLEVQLLWYITLIASYFM